MPRGGEGDRLSRASRIMLGLVALMLTGCGADKAVAVSKAAPVVKQAKRPALSLHDGKFVIDARSLPCIGSPDAGTLVALLFDYTCGSCFDLKKQAAEAVAASDGKLGVLCVPAVRGADSEAMHRLMLTLFHADAELHHEIEARISTDVLKAKPADLRAAIAAALGGEAVLAGTEKKFAAQIDAQLGQAKELLAANKEILGSTNVPQLMAQGKIATGRRRSAEHFLAEALGTALPEEPAGDLVFETPDANFGRIPGGTLTNYIVKVANRGKEDRFVTGMKLPDDYLVVKALPAKIAAGATETMILRWRFPLKTGDYQETVLLKNRGKADAALKIKADLWEAYSLSAPAAEILMGKDGKAKAPAPLIVTLKEAAALAARETGSGLKTSVKALGDDGRRYEISFTIDPAKPPLPQGRHVFLSLSPLAPGASPVPDAPAFVVLPVDLKSQAPAISKS